MVTLAILAAASLFKSQRPKHDIDVADILAGALIVGGSVYAAEQYDQASSKTPSPYPVPETDGSIVLAAGLITIAAARRKYI